MSGWRRFGRVRQLPSGRWQARYPGPDGMLRNAPQTLARKADADRWLSAAETDLGRGDWADPEAAHLDRFVRPAKSAWVFLGPKGARPTRNNFHTVWAKAREAAGIPDLHLHDLRHTGNTLAAETGVTLRELMDRMGRSSTRAALIYLHAREERGKEIADGIDAMVRMARKNAPKKEKQGGKTRQLSDQSKHE